jgi:N-acetylneuraminate lyase
LRYKGLVAAVHTPFHLDGALNLDVIPRQAEHLLATGVRAAFVGGSTGESHSLTVEERIALTRRWTEVARGTSLSVIAHIGCNCQADVVTLAREAARSGVEAISALAPSYFKPSSVDDLITFLAAPAKSAGDLPFYFYDIPSMTGVTLSMVKFLTDAPARIPNLAGIKYTNMDAIQFQECARFRDGAFDILWGTDETLLAALALGAEGAVGSSYNFAAPIYHRVIAAFDRGDWPAARQAQADSIAVIRLLQRYSYLPAAKYVMTLLGVPVGPARSPLPGLGDAQKQDLERELKESGLWSAIQPRRP